MSDPRDDLAPDLFDALLDEPAEPELFDSDGEFNGGGPNGMVGLGDTKPWPKWKAYDPELDARHAELVELLRDDPPEETTYSKRLRVLLQQALDEGLDEPDAKLARNALACPHLDRLLREVTDRVNKLLRHAQARRQTRVDRASA